VLLFYNDKEDFISSDLTFYFASIFSSSFEDLGKVIGGGMNV